MGKGVTIEVRISQEKKIAAQARAAEQGIALSAGVRRLLTLWVEGKIDLAALDRLPYLPAVEDLEDLARTLQMLSEVLRAVQGTLGESTTKVAAFTTTYSAVLRENNLLGLYARVNRMHRRR